MTFDDTAWARIARGRLNSSLDQPTCTAQHGISERTLRDWVRRFGAGRRPQAQLPLALPNRHPGWRQQTSILDLDQSDRQVLADFEAMLRDMPQDAAEEAQRATARRRGRTG